MKSDLVKPDIVVAPNAKRRKTVGDTRVVLDKAETVSDVPLPTQKWAEAILVVDVFGVGWSYEDIIRHAG